MAIDTDVLATCVMWNLSLKCHEAGRRHRHSIPDQHADRLLLDLECHLLDKGLTLQRDLDVLLDERTYRRARRRVFPEGRHADPMTPSPQRRSRDRLDLPLSCESLLALYEAAMRRTDLPHALARRTDELRLAECGYLMVKELMARVSRKSWSDDDLMLMGWMEADAPESPRLVEFDQGNSSHPGSPLSAWAAGTHVPFAFQQRGSTEPVWLPFSSGNFAAKVFRDVTFRGDFYAILVVLCTYSPNPQAFLDAVTAHGGAPVTIDELACADWPFFGIPINIELEWVYTAVSSDDDCVYLICEAGLPRVFPSKHAASAWLTVQLGRMRAKI